MLTQTELYHAEGRIVSWPDLPGVPPLVIAEIIVVSDQRVVYSDLKRWVDFIEGSSYRNLDEKLNSWRWATDEEVKKFRASRETSNANRIQPSDSSPR